MADDVVIDVVLCVRGVACVSSSSRSEAGCLMGIDTCREVDTDGVRLA